MTFAVANGNLELTKFLFNVCLCNSRKMLKVPGLFNSQLFNRLFPLIVSLTQAASSQSNFSVSHGVYRQDNSLEMFTYFWEDLGEYMCWNEDSLESLFKLLARRELPDMLPLVFGSKTAHTIYEAMSYQYRFAFVEHLLQARHDLLDEITAAVQQAEKDANESHMNEDEMGQAEEFLYEKSASMNHFFTKVYEALSQQPYSL